MSGMCRDCGEFFGSQNGYCSQCVQKRENGGEEVVEVSTDIARIRIEEARRRREEEQRLRGIEEREEERRRIEGIYAADLTKNQKILILFGAAETVKIAIFGLLCIFGFNIGWYLCIWVGLFYCCVFACCNLVLIPCCSLLGVPCCCCGCCDCFYTCSIPLASLGIFCFIAGPFLTCWSPLMLCFPNPALFLWFFPELEDIDDILDE